MATNRDGVPRTGVRSSETWHSHNEFDTANAHRAEIEQRTIAGETCKQIASALNERGISVSHQTISRRRLAWGHRQRKQPSSVGKPRPHRPGYTRARPEGWDKPETRLRYDKPGRKAEITERTVRGETAEQILEAMHGRGWVIKKGLSTIVRARNLTYLIFFP